MILVDSSVIIDYTRGKEAKLAGIFNTRNLAVCGVVRAEVLAGSRSIGERGKHVAVLNSLIRLSTPEVLWDVIGDYAAALRAGGFTIPLADVVIAAVAIANGLELWSRDKHFKLVQPLLPALKLFQEPP